jgi:hypothetical protein
MKKRMDPSKIVQEATIKKTQGTWLHRLPDDDYEYVMELVDCMSKHTNASHYRVADALILELGLQESRGTVALTLKGLRDGKA